MFLLEMPGHEVDRADRKVANFAGEHIALVPGFPGFGLA